jgi:hypothetical protein
MENYKRRNIAIHHGICLRSGFTGNSKDSDDSAKKMGQEGFFGPNPSENTVKVKFQRNS